MTPKMWEYYCNFKGEVLGLKDLYFHHVKHENVLHWKGYSEKSKRYNEPIGAHKLIRKDIMNRLDFTPFLEKSKFPDEQPTPDKLHALGIQTTLVSMKETGGIAVDVKNKDSATPFRKWDNTEWVKFENSLGKSSYLTDLLKMKR